jgi:hypothetical protein
MRLAYQSSPQINRRTSLKSSPRSRRRSLAHTGRATSGVAGVAFYPPGGPRASLVSHFLAAIYPRICKTGNSAGPTDVGDAHRKVSVRAARRPTFYGAGARCAALGRTVQRAPAASVSASATTSTPCSSSAPTNLSQTSSTRLWCFRPRGPGSRPRAITSKRT